MRPRQGVLILDNNTLDKPYAEEIGVVTYHWSRSTGGLSRASTSSPSYGPMGRPHPHRLQGVCPPPGRVDEERPSQSPLGRGGEPWLRARVHPLRLLVLRPGEPEAAVQAGWRWLTQLKPNRLVNPDGRGNTPTSTLSIPEEGFVVHLRGYGWVKVFQRTDREGGLEYRATSDLEMERGGWERYAAVCGGWRSTTEA